MSNRANTNQRRNWIKDFITNNAPTTVQHITDAALKANLKALSTDPTKAYYTVSKDTVKLRREGQVPTTSIIYRVLQDG